MRASTYGRDWKEGAMAAVSTAAKAATFIACSMCETPRPYLYLEIIGQRRNIADRQAQEQFPARSSTPIVAAAHAYQVSSARDELPRRNIIENKNLL